jgi:3-oxoacyl-[acyl-carrier-protein] synthase II
MKVEPLKKAAYHGAPGVWVTGYGCVSAMGPDVDSTWRGILEGKSTRRALTAIPVEGCRVTEGAEVEMTGLVSAKPGSRKPTRASVLLQACAREALGVAGLLDAQGRCRLEQVQLCASTTACGMEAGERFLRSIWESRNRGRTALVASHQAQQQIRDLHRALGFSGPVMIVANACASGANAIGHAFDLIRCGMAEIVFATGYDALCELVFTGFDGLQALSPDLCRPFDRRRNGLMLGEGAAFLVLESETHARQRGVPAHGVVLGYGHSTDLGHLTQPEAEGKPLIAAMHDALARAGLRADQIGYINAHGTGTPLNDGAEGRAIEAVFAGTSARLSSTKAALGHTLGAAGAIEAVLCLQTLKTGGLPPQINLGSPEETVADRLVALGEKRHIRHALSLNLGFGGSAAAIVFGSVENDAPPNEGASFQSGQEMDKAAVCSLRSG